MNKNQKIALGCGVAGCLGFILIVIVIVLLGVLGYVAIPGTSNRNYNYNSSRNSNSDSNDNTTSSSDSNTNSNSDSSGSSASSMSDDDKHKLFQAAGITRDQVLIERVVHKIGFANNSIEAQQFVNDHTSWALRNGDFIRSVITPEAARAYVEEHIND